MNKEFCYLVNHPRGDEFQSQHESKIRYGNFYIVFFCIYQVYILNLANDSKLAINELQNEQTKYYTYMKFQRILRQPSSRKENGLRNKSTKYFDHVAFPCDFFWRLFHEFDFICVWFFSSFRSFML